MKHFKLSILALTFSLLTLSFTGCGLGQHRMGQAEMTAFETRPLDAPFKSVYEAATEALFDLGYTMTHSDKETGILVGEKRVQKPGMWLWGDIPADKRVEDYYDWLQLTILVKEEGKKESKVRIKTAVNKEPKMNKGAIDEVWLYIQRQVMMSDTPAPKKK